MELSLSFSFNRSGVLRGVSIRIILVFIRTFGIFGMALFRHTFGIHFYLCVFRAGIEKSNKECTVIDSEKVT